MEQVNGRQRSKRRPCLQCDYCQGVLGTLPQPSNREVCDYRHLPGHQQLPQMGGSAFIRLTSRAVQGDLNEHMASAANDIPTEEKRWASSAELE